MDNVILLGNGLNRLSEGYSWESLLAKLVEKLCYNKISYDAAHQTPFPLFYEEILSDILSDELITEKHVKQFISDEIGNIQLNECHGLLSKVRVNDFLTTNYDYMIEKVIFNDDSYYNIGPVEENKYSVFRRISMSGTHKSVWHIHGEARKYNTITLGYDHYAGYLQTLRESATTDIGEKYKDFKLNKLWDRLTETEVVAWIDFFFRKNVHIVGLSLDFSEIDLWWLLVYRARSQL